MTDRIRHLTVVLDRDIRTDDIEPVITALHMVKGVASVEAHITDLRHHIAMNSVRSEIEGKLYEAIGQIFHPDRKGT